MAGWLPHGVLWRWRIELREDLDPRSDAVGGVPHRVVERRTGWALTERRARARYHAAYDQMMTRLGGDPRPA
jgi:hypothetical protein